MTKDDLLRLLNLLRTNELFDCDEAFQSLSVYPDGDYCLRIKDHDGINKTMAEIVVFMELMDIKKISQGELAITHSEHEHTIWKLKKCEFMHLWLLSKFPSKEDLIISLGGQKYGRKKSDV